MFSGIIGEVKPIQKVSERGGCCIVRIEKPRGWKLQNGQSISVDGICSTVVRSGSDSFYVEYMPETLSKTTAAYFKKGDHVNLERSLMLKDSVDGHITYGHVDAAVRVLGLKKHKSACLVSVAMPKRFRIYIIPQGAIAINGVSLTIARVARGSFTVALIPYTLKYTNLGDLKKGSLVNIEIDPLARYAVARGKQRGIVPRNAKKAARKNKKA